MGAAAGAVVVVVVFIRDTATVFLSPEASAGVGVVVAVTDIGVGRLAVLAEVVVVGGLLVACMKLAQ